MTYSYISLSQKGPDKRKMIQMAQKITLKTNYIPRQSRERICDVRSFQLFFFPPSNLASGAAVMAALQRFEFFPYIYDIRYILR